MAVSGRARPLSGLLETDLLPPSVTYDALNRPVSVTTPDHSVYRPTFNEANLLDRVDVNRAVRPPTVSRPGRPLSQTSTITPRASVR